ncbi:MAG TPA: hypothetical protein VKU00_30555 [Chthonomonadaceae bacterium]|nr:hypothetical protein [Chthonomonadaceae bacterium]
MLPDINMPDIRQQATRENLAEQMEETIYMILDRLDRATSGREARELAEALAVLVDALLLLRGQPTKREVRQRRLRPVLPASIQPEGGKLCQKEPPPVGEQP